jgi:hypothetical protein
MNIATDWLVLLLRSQEFLGSNLGPETNNPTGRFCGFPQFPQEISEQYLKLDQDGLLPSTIQFKIQWR